MTYETLVRDTSRDASLRDAAPPRRRSVTELSSVQHMITRTGVEGARTSEELMRLNTEKIITG